MSLSADIFNIERASLNDGPGIRTVVYVKGCSLSCVWCHNPEGIKFENEIAYYSNRCVLCGSCQRVCPQGCYEVMDDKLKINYDSCIKCHKCTENCLTNALKLCAKSMTSDEVLLEILKDKEYFDKSGGGVTFSGGECLLNTDFMCDILKKCKEKGIKTLVESAFYVPWKNIESVASFVDMFYVDIKHMNSKKHKEYTGKGNELILDNIAKLVEICNRVMIRIPLIPGVNDDKENLIATYDFVSKLGIKNIMLLRYNSLGESKYTALNKKFFVPKGSEQTENSMKKLCFDLNAQIHNPEFFITEYL